MKQLVLGLLAAAVGIAAESTVGGPLLGHVESGETIRPVLGIPGAARLGDPVAQGVTKTAISGAAGFALGCVAGELRRIDLATAATAAVAELEGCPNHVALSPLGKSAALLYQGKVRIVKDTPFTLAGTFDMAAHTCAVNDAADWLLCSSDSGLYAVDAQGGTAKLLDVPGTVAVFVPDSRDAIVAGGGVLYALRDGTELRRLTDVSDASAVALADEGKTAVAFSRSSGKIVLAPLDGTPGQTLDSPLQIGAATAFGKDVLHLASSDPGPVWMLVKQQGEFRLMFVPQVEAGNE